MKDELMPDRSVDDLIAERDAAQEQAAQLRELLAAFVDDEPCEHFNHHGECETHGNTRYGRCMNAAAVAYLAETEPADPDEPLSETYPGSGIYE